MHMRMNDMHIAAAPFVPDVVADVSEHKLHFASISKRKITLRSC